MKSALVIFGSSLSFVIFFMLNVILNVVALGLDTLVAVCGKYKDICINIVLVIGVIGYVISLISGYGTDQTVGLVVRAVMGLIGGVILGLIVKYLFKFSWFLSTFIIVIMIDIFVAFLESIAEWIRERYERAFQRIIVTVAKDFDTVIVRVTR